jgi:Phosphodiester glycosidase
LEDRPRSFDSTRARIPEGVRRRPKRWIAVLAVLILLIPTLVSYMDALTGPGNDKLSIRSVEWLRSHHYRWAVNDVENWWYTHHAPKKGGVPSQALQAQIAGGARATTTTGGATSTTAPRVDQAAPAILPAPAPLAPLATPALDGEGQWQALGQPVHGQVAMYATYMRPDAEHTSEVTGIAWIDPKLLRAVGYAGALEPGGSGWADQLPIPTAARTALEAAFNSGFKMSDAQGGYYDHGRYHGTLEPGAATLWITTDGVLHVGEWGRDGTLTPTVVFARQNLHLIVDGGQPVPDVDTNDPAKWGYTVGNAVLVWRSGIGVTADGAIVYAGGPGMSAYTLARLLARAGAVRAMELDINSDWVDFFYYSPGKPGTPTGELTVNKLLVDMTPSTDNYLSASSRDCIALFRR